MNLSTLWASIKALFTSAKPVNYTPVTNAENRLNVDPPVPGPIDIPVLTDRVNDPAPQAATADKAVWRKPGQQLAAPSVLTSRLTIEEVNAVILDAYTSDKPAAKPVQKRGRKKKTPAPK